uniref:Luciferin 4-monooxygenase n=1 Tax=Cacopsylla melanoneura TaxID=428564 RepID=A0A8D8XRH3_9HEMI
MAVHLQSCLKISRPMSISLKHNIKQKVFHNRYGVPFSLHSSNFRFVRCASSANYVQESTFGPVDIPNVSLPSFIFKDIGQWMDKPMITCGSSGRTYNYGEGRFITRQFAIALLKEIGLKKGDVVGILMPNIPEYAFAIHGALEAGLVVTFVNPLYTPDEVRRQFDDAEVKCCITIPQLLEVGTKIGATLPNFRGTIVVGGENDKSNNVYGFKQLVSSQPPDYQLPKVSPNDLAMLPYSSGTTGVPKGVQLSHNNCAVNLEQCIHPDINNHIPTSETSQETVLSVLPFFHIYGFNGILNVVMMYGMHMITIPKFTPETYIECVIKYKPTILFVVPSLLLFLASHPAITAQHLASIREVTCGAAPATKTLIDKFKQKVQREDITIRQGYGMTETSPCTLYTRFSIPEAKLGSTGQLVRGTQARIVSLTTGENLPPHQSGELYVKGPQVMLGYLKNEKATKETVDSEGWLHTGDVAYYDEDGYFYIVDRTKELIKVKGNQVSPTELENILMQIPGVADVAVVGVPDTLSGEVPRAFIVKKPGVELAEKDITSYVEPKVAPYKKLAGGVKFLDNIPRNPAGKVLRNELKVFGADPTTTHTHPPTKK